jgi:hypothetical protein
MHRGPPNFSGFLQIAWSNSVCKSRFKIHHKATKTTKKEITEPQNSRKLKTTDEHRWKNKRIFHCHPAFGSVQKIYFENENMDSCPGRFFLINSLSFSKYIFCTPSAAGGRDGNHPYIPRLSMANATAERSEASL